MKKLFLVLALATISNASFSQLVSAKIFPEYGDNPLAQEVPHREDATVDMTVISGTTGIPSNITGNVANTNGSGSGAIVNWTTDFVPATNPGNFTSIVVSTAGSGYAIGDLIKLNPEPADNFGGNGAGTTSITLQSSNFSPVNLIQGSTDFEISESTQTEVILEILKYSGIIIRDPQIIQAAQQELVQDEANEKR